MRFQLANVRLTTDSTLLVTGETAIPLSKTWSAYAECNLGRNLQTAGGGVAVVLPRLH